MKRIQWKSLAGAGLAAAALVAAPAPARCGEIDERRPPEARLRPAEAEPLTAATVADYLSSPTVVPPGSYALSIDADLDLGGFVFKEGYPLLHTEGGAAYGNTALGLNALISVTPGVPTSSFGRANTAIGTSTLESLTTGFSNTAVGVEALAFNTIGSTSVAVGSFALHSNTNGSANTAVGSSAMQDNTTGAGNTAVGSFALFRNTEGDLNSTLGFRALHSNTSGYYNAVLGGRAMYSNTTGYLNTASGYAALRKNEEGHHNTATGSYALWTNTASHNTATGNLAMYNNTSGARNTALGRGAGFFNATGSDNVWIASYGVGGTEAHTLRIGNATGTGPFQLERAFISGIRGITTGEPDAVAVFIDSDGQLGTMSSSRRVKEDIYDMGASSDALHELRPVTFRYKRPFDDGSKPIRYGLIAEEVAEIYPDLVAYDEDGAPATVRYHALVPMLLNEVRKQHAEIARQRREIADLRAARSEVEDLRTRLSRLEQLAPP